MPYSGASGNYGSIPESLIRSKYEITRDHFNPETMNNYYRETLKDVRPEKPFFESDQTRRDNHSGERLSLRFSGDRGDGVMPWMPDQFLELTDRDPRGTSDLPNFREAYNQGLARMKYVNFYPDGDPKTNERVKTDMEHNRDKANAFYQVKDRMKWFDTSKDSVAAARNFRRFPGDSLMQAIDPDRVERLTSVPEALRRPHNSYTTKLSNDTLIGWYSTSDHDFKVANYGPVRSIKQYNDPNQLLKETVLDSEKLTTFQDQVVSTGLASTMRKISEEQKLRYNYQDIKYGLEKQHTPLTYTKKYGDYGAQRLDSEVGAFRNLVVKDISPNYGLAPHLNKSHRESMQTNKLAEMMEAGTQSRNAISKNKTNYRKTMEQQLMDWKMSKGFVDGKTVGTLGRLGQSKDIGARHATSNHKWEQSRNTKNYNGVAPQHLRVSDNTTHESFRKQSKSQANKKLEAFVKNVDQTKSTQDDLDFHALPSGTGRSGSKRPTFDRTTYTEKTIFAPSINDS